MMEMDIHAQDTEAEVTDTEEESANWARTDKFLSSIPRKYLP
jgi:hypothetical protein